MYDVCAVFSYKELFLPTEMSVELNNLSNFQLHYFCRDSSWEFKVCFLNYIVLCLITSGIYYCKFSLTLITEWKSLSFAKDEQLQPYVNLQPCDADAPASSSEAQGAWPSVHSALRTLLPDNRCLLVCNWIVTGPGGCDLPLTSHIPYVKVICTLGMTVSLSRYLYIFIHPISPLVQQYSFLRLDLFFAKQPESSSCGRTQGQFSGDSLVDQVWLFPGWAARWWAFF